MTASILAMAAVAFTPSGITNVVEKPIHAGINHVAGFLPGGGDAMIVRAWRDNGNAHGYFVWMVVAERKGDAALVEFEGRRQDGSTIAASPFDGERVTADVRFATARIGGKRVSLAVEGWLESAADRPIADHVPATIRWFRLVHRDEPLGEAPDAFVPIGQVSTSKHYCNVDLALRDVAHLPLPLDFAGANRVDGCFGEH